MADGKAKGRSRNALDTIVAATARANHCVVVNDNERDFMDAEFIDPVRGIERRQGRTGTARRPERR